MLQGAYFQVTQSQWIKSRSCKNTIEQYARVLVYYRAHVQNTGWQSCVKDGQGLRIEALKIKIVKIADGSTPAPSAFNTVINKN